MILKNDTSNVIEFNSSFSDDMKENKPRSFWKLFNKQWKKAIIISIKGYKLLEKEREILRNEKPWGLILFKRNINNLNQIKKLIKEIRIVSKDRKFPIMIDEEGSSVTRLSKILYNNVSQKNLGDFYLIEKKISLLIYKNYIKR